MTEEICNILIFSYFFHSDEKSQENKTIKLKILTFKEYNVREREDLSSQERR